MTFRGPGDRILDLIPRAGVTDLRELGLNERQIEALRLMVNEGIELPAWAKELDERQVEAVLYVGEHGQITNPEYRDLTDVSRRWATKELQEKEFPPPDFGFRISDLFHNSQSAIRNPKSLVVSTGPLTRYLEPHRAWKSFFNRCGWWAFASASLSASSRKHVFVDWAGDPGFRFRRGSSSYLVVVVVFTGKYDTLQQRLRDFRRERRVGEHFHFHYADTSERL